MDMRNFYRRNLPVLLVLGIILALAGAGAAKQAAALPAGSWGLSFQQEGQPPVGNTTADRLRQYDAAFLGDTAQKRIYLTFDAGYENGCTAQILDALQKHHAPAAFFLVGNYIERNPDLVRRMAQEGHTVGKENSRSLPSRLEKSTSTISGMISPALRTRTTSPMRMSFCAIKSLLCTVAARTVLPESCTGSSTAVGVSTPVRPTLTTMSSRRVDLTSGGYL